MYDGLSLFRLIVVQCVYAVCLCHSNLYLIELFLSYFSLPRFARCEKLLANVFGLHLWQWRTFSFIMTDSSHIFIVQDRGEKKITLTIIQKHYTFYITKHEDLSFSVINASTFAAINPLSSYRIRKYCIITP